MQLDQRKLSDLTYSGSDKRQHIVWDSALPGFGVRLYPSGIKKYVIKYRHNGKQHIITIGSCGLLTLAEAREKAGKCFSGLKGGQDPQKALSRQQVTLADFSKVFIDRYSKTRKKTWLSDIQRINNWLIPAWGNWRLSAITRSDVALLHDEIGKTYPVAANRVREQISKMFNMAKIWGYLEDNALNPANGIPDYPEQARDRWLNTAEISKLLEAAKEEKSIHVRHAIGLYLLTGLRKTELLKIKWEDIDWERRELRLPETKAGRPHYLPLSDAAIGFLEDLPRSEDNPYCIPGKIKGARLINIDKAWRRIRQRAGLTDVRLHDLRRTTGSSLSQMGYSLHLIGRVLNQSTPSVTAVYARFAQDHVREALEAHAKRILPQAPSEEPREDLSHGDNVIQLKLWHHGNHFESETI